MTARTVVFDEVGSLDAPPGTRPWAVAVRDELRSALRDERSAAEHIERLTTLMATHHGYRHFSDALGSPFPSMEAFCVAAAPDGLGYSQAAINGIVDERREMHAARLASSTEALTTPGGDRRSEAYQGSHDYLDMEIGRGSDYLAARIARDRPDVLERMKAGEFPSVRAAAIEAGIITPQPRMSVPADPDGLAAALARRLSPADLASLIRALVALTEG